ncbi:MAG: helix-turn-helix transcriptional regulator [Telmatospirillum sp.]|nr:helix-turn-helix transcriptional regulator [Telmatospirillum sp.]
MFSPRTDRWDDPPDRKDRFAILVGSQIRRHRTAAGLSGPDLAGMLNMPPDRLARYENGQDRPPAMLLPLLAQALNLPVSALFREPAPD